MSEPIIMDPAGGGAICRPCGAYHPTLGRARQCSHIGRTLPVIPGDPEVTRPTYAPAAPRFSAPGDGTVYSPTAPAAYARVFVRVVAALFVLAMVALFAMAVVSLARDVDRVAPGCGVACVPAMWETATGGAA